MTTVSRLVASGNFSDPSIFLNGVKPLPGMVVCANGFTGVINENLLIGGQYSPQVNAGSFVTGVWYMIEDVGTTTWTTIGAAANIAGTRFQATGAGSGTGRARAIGTLTTAAIGGASAGGGFQVTSGTITIAADIRSGTTQCLSLTSTANLILDGTGTFSGLPIRLQFLPGTVAGSHAIGHGSTGNINLIQSLGGHSSTTGVHGINVTNGGSITLNAGIYATSANAPSSVINNSNGSLTADGATFDASGTAANVANTLSIGASASASVINSTIRGGALNSNGIIVSGSLTGSGNTIIGGYAIVASTGTPSFNLTNNTYIATSLGPAIYIILATIVTQINGIEVDHAGSGFSAVIALRRTFGTIAPFGAYRQGFLAGGASYILGDSGYTGFALPNPSNVLEGVTYGGNLVGTLNQTSPTVEQIRTALGMASANLDSQLVGILSSVNLRMLASSYTAPPSADTISTAVNNALDRTGFSLTTAERTAISTAVQAGILNESDGQAILNAIVNAIGNQNIDQVALVAAIRSDLERNGGVLATRLATSEYASPLNAQGIRDAIGITTANIDTQLSGINNNISLRMLASSYTEPPNSNSIATQVRTELTPELNRINNELLDTDYYQQYLLQALQATISVS